MAARSRRRRGSAGSLQSIRDWVLRFNAKGPEGLIEGKASGPEAKLSEAQRAALKAIVEQGPIPAVQEVVR